MGLRAIDMSCEGIWCSEGGRLSCVNAQHDKMSMSYIAGCKLHVAGAAVAIR